MPFDIYKCGIQDHEIKSFLRIWSVYKERQVYITFHMNVWIIYYWIFVVYCLLLLLWLFLYMELFSSIIVKDIKGMADERDGENLNHTLNTIRMSIKWRCE